MGSIADRVEMAACPACGKEVSSQAPACPACGQPIRQQQGDALGIAILLIPVLSTALLWLWVANMNLLQRPDESISAIVIGTVAITAILVAVEAGMLGASALTWFFGMGLMWIFAYPMWFFERAKRGTGNVRGIAILVTIVFIGSAAALYSAVESKKSEIRERLSRVSDIDREPARRAPPIITADKFAAVSNGMSYSKVVSIIGVAGEQISSTEVGDYKIVAVAWKNDDGSNALLTFQNGKLESKAQFGLR